ncbi:hypothetical protein GOP47_0006469 [Adiantum capillus-veneris]|uniref:glucan endo-1,3-beta-D-glucosidase n=1 Tax=Adiantum capillus-veneris TaxID=13818 RepID=A0A9D4V3X7_ADICA|nr:hypothetical protein GOP47_0006469 [Adiantum capillus-veneris]
MAAPLFLATALLVTSFTGAYSSLGINYGTLGDNLPPAAEVASFLKAAAKGPIVLSKVKLFNTDPNIILAFANTGVDIIIGMSTADLIEVGNRASISAATQWVEYNVAPYVPATSIVGVAVGNEVVLTHDKALIAHVVPAMQNLHLALNSLNLSTSICVSSPFTLGILHSSVPPSSATFKKPSLMVPVLSFLASNGFPFMANVYPFFAYASDPNPFMLDYALFNSSAGYTDPLTNLHYTNMFDAQLDAIYSAMAHLGFSNISIMVTETGWPSSGDPTQVGVNVNNAQMYINNLIEHIYSNQGTPLRPKQPVDTYIFALFNEDLKPGPTSERNYGLFKPDFTPVYSTVLLDSALSVNNKSSTSDAALSSKMSPTPSPTVSESPSTSLASSQFVKALVWNVPLLIVATLIVQNTNLPYTLSQ